MPDLVCRSCLGANPKMHYISNTRYLEMYEQHTDIKLNIEDGDPETICYVCMAQLRRFSKFIEMSQLADKALKRLLSNGTQLTPSSVELDRMNTKQYQVTKSELVSIINNLEDVSEVVVKMEPVDYEEAKLITQEYEDLSGVNMHDKEIVIHDLNDDDESDSDNEMNDDENVLYYEDGRDIQENEYPEEPGHLYEFSRDSPYLEDPDIVINRRYNNIIKVKDTVDELNNIMIDRNIDNIDVDRDSIDKDNRSIEDIDINIMEEDTYTNIVGNNLVNIIDINTMEEYTYRNIVGNNRDTMNMIDTTDINTMEEDTDSNIVGKNRDTVNIIDITLDSDNEIQILNNEKHEEAYLYNLEDNISLTHSPSILNKNTETNSNADTERSNSVCSNDNGKPSYSSNNADLEIDNQRITQLLQQVCVNLDRLTDEEIKRHCSRKSSETETENTELTTDEGYYAYRYNCTECNYKTNFKPQYIKHTNAHTRMSLYSCEICSHQFNSLYIYTNHRRYNCYKCKICGKTFSYYAKMKQHMALHAREEFPCPLCPRKFNLSKKLTAHIEHKHAFKYRCEICYKPFVKKTGPNGYYYHIQSKKCRNLLTVSENEFEAYNEEKLGLVHFLKYNTGMCPYPCEMCSMKMDFSTLLA